MSKRYPENCRVFIGNLDNSAATQEVLANIFGKYGKLVEPVQIHNGYAFAQYDNPESATAAIKNERGTPIGQKNIDTNTAKSSKGFDRPPLDRRDDKRDDRREPPRIDRRDDFRDDRQNRSFERRGRSPPRRESFGKRERSFSEDRQSKKHLVEKFVPSSQYKSTFSLDPVYIIPCFVIHTALRDYATHVGNVFQQAGFNLDIQYLNKRDFQKSIDDAVDRGVRYIMYINGKHEDIKLVSFRAITPAGTSPGFAEVAPHDALAFCVKNERDFSQVYRDQMPPQPYYQQPYGQHDQYPRDFHGGQHGQQMHMSFPQPTQHLQGTQQFIPKQQMNQHPTNTVNITPENNPELQSVLLNLLASLKQDEGKKDDTVVNMLSNLTKQYQ